MQIFWDYNEQDYLNVFKIVLAFYILFGTFILKLLISQKDRFIRNDKWWLITFVVFLILSIRDLFQSYSQIFKHNLNAPLVFLKSF